ncbi:tRNA (guanosine(46)-N7)-methyltransferase TrmB [Scatolibacter rhodanostii]|uniref:tRNA (guanosine(46)-N7)-methyltransferase TrmB n=1 Tax=Scatolibacter rhodanostii TaxID=2014781 RepID=UPI000C069A2C|nr:tRNA (guanosine(46)-N7)-methyltransferase TrmB [Scatolibacter rhodanostii]
MRIRRKTWARPELEACSYFYQNPQQNKSIWNTEIAAGKPIHLDLGCGKAVFLAEIALENPDVHYIGVDISFDILGVARRNIEAKFEEKKVENISLFSYNIEKLEDVLSPADKVERIYINFCNPWPKAGDHKKRLTYTKQLKAYQRILSPGAEIWFKTDNDDLYLASLRYFEEAGLSIFFQTKDLHQETNIENHLTEHEIMFTKEGIKTKAIRAKFVGI